MTSTWAVVVAALGASALTGLVSFGVTAISWRRDQRAASQKARYEAYIAVLQAASGVMVLGQALALLIPVRTGLAEGLNVILRIRKPIDPLEFGDRFGRALVPLLDASARVRVHGTQRAIDAASHVVDRATDFMGAALQSDASESGVGTRVRGFVRGNRPTAEQQREATKALSDFTSARAAFLSVVRSEVGEAPVAAKTSASTTY